MPQSRLLQFNTLAPHRRTLALVVIHPHPRPYPAVFLLLSGTHTSLSPASSYVAISDARLPVPEPKPAREFNQMPGNCRLRLRLCCRQATVSRQRLRSNALTRTGISARFAWLSAAPKWDYVTFLS